ncbi:MAG: hypothetical protein RIT81_22975, partial [Deltaproteobacteria bacterium]
VVQVRVPDELNFDRTGQVEPNQVGNGCSTLCYPRQEALWVFDSLASGETQTITIDALVDASYVDGTLIALPVRVEADQVPDTIDRLHVVRIDSPSAELVLSASNDPVTPGETFDFIIDVGNPTVGALVGSELRIVLPRAVTFVSASTGGTWAGDSVTWTTGALASGATRRHSARVTADSSVALGEVLAARAELTFAGGLELDNTSEFSATVSGILFPLHATMMGSPASATSGSSIDYTIVVENTSSLPVDGIAVLTRVPDELSISCGASVCGPRSEIFWNVGTLAGGQTQTIAFTASVPPSVETGRLIAAPLRVAGDSIGDVIDLYEVTLVSSN